MTLHTVLSDAEREKYWPALPFADWQATAETLHLWTQIVGKVRLAQTPWANHSWHVTLYVTTRGLTTSVIPYGQRTFEIDFDFVDHVVRITDGGGQVREIPLEPQSTAEFYRRVMTGLEELGLTVTIHARPNEVEAPIPFAEDHTHASYDPEAANRIWRVLLQVDRIFKEFRAGFVGKSSPVHFFWGSFDLAVTRFSGRTAPEHPGGFPNLPDWITREAYSHEVSSAGFWSGAAAMPEAIFYSYAYPVPDGYGEFDVQPEQARWVADLGEFVLPYDAVREADSPDRTLMAFLESTYEAAATTGNWDRQALEDRRLFPSAASS